MIRMTSILLALALAACGSNQDAADEAEVREGRDETQSIRNTDAIGYSGGAIADKVDSALDANEEYKKKQDAEIDDQLD